jgi:hypothetical protein
MAKRRKGEETPGQRRRRLQWEARERAERQRDEERWREERERLERKVLEEQAALLRRQREELDRPRAGAGTGGGLLDAALAGLGAGLMVGLPLLGAAELMRLGINGLCDLEDRVGR